MEWLRDHGMGSVVNGVQHWWYSTHPPPQGRQPHPPDRRRLAAGLVAGALGADVDGGRAHRRPDDIASPAAHPVPNEGRWLARRSPRRRHPDDVRDPGPTRRGAHERARRAGLDGSEAPAVRAAPGHRGARGQVDAAARCADGRAPRPRGRVQQRLPDPRRPGRLLPRRHDPGAARRRRRVARHRPERLGDGGAVGARRAHGPRRRGRPPEPAPDRRRGPRGARTRAQRQRRLGPHRRPGRARVALGAVRRRPWRPHLRLRQRARAPRRWPS